MKDFEIVLTFEGYVNRKEILPTGVEHIYQFSKEFFQTLPQWDLVQTIVSFMSSENGLDSLKVYLEKSLSLSSEIIDGKSLDFNLDNPYDLKTITLVPDLNDRRTIINFINSPFRDFYLFEHFDKIRIVVSLNNKSYFTHSPLEVVNFFRIIDNNVELNRDLKLNYLLNNSISSISPNIIRQFKFKIENGDGWDNLFGNIWQYYLECGKLSNKQLDWVLKGLNWK
jgi:hypothetical protein